ncbi:unnamed protein product, partial [Prorocentrum cordatum]
MASGDSFNSSVDPEFPVLRGETLKDFTRYKRAVQAAELGCESKEQRTALGLTLHPNLLGADNSISVLIELSDAQRADPKDYAVEDGANVLKFLETERFAKNSFRKLPKAFGAFSDLAHFERKGEEPMAAFCTAMEVARRLLEEVNPDTKISSNELGYHALKRSGLDMDERDLVMARADETLNFAKISATWTMHADDTETGRANGEDQHNGEYWVQADDGHWHERDDDDGVHACTDEDEEGDRDISHLFYLEADVFLAGEDDDYHRALVAMRESCIEMSKLRAARGLFEERVDGVVDESAAASGHAGGKSSGKGKGKGKDGGKSKYKRCNRCGRMDHSASECLANGQSGKPAKGKGRGNGSKSAPRPRRHGFWAVSALACAAPSCVDVGHQVRHPNANYIHMQPEKDNDIMMVNLDTDPIVPDRPEFEVMISSDVVPAPLVGSALAGRGWLDRVEAELTKHCLKPGKVEARQKFRGLGGARRESKQKWVILLGIGKKHTLLEYFEIPGDMVGLTSRGDLAEWKTNLYLREDGRWADFQELGVHGKELKLPGGHVGLDLFDSDLESHESEPLFERFRAGEMQLEPGAFLVAETPQEYEPGFQVKGRADSRVAEAPKNGSNGIFKKGALKRIDKWMKNYSIIFDVLRNNQETFLLGLFAKEPWIVSVAFQCAPFSNVQEFQRAQGMGDQVGDLIEEFRPLVNFSAKVLRTQAEGGRVGIGENHITSRAWNEEPIMDMLRWRGERPPLYETVALRQCMFALTDDYGMPIRKATRMLVPNGSCSPWWLDRKCDQRHEHADMVGRGALLSRASAWPDDLGKILVSAGTQRLARRTDLKKLGIGDDATKVPDQRTMRTVAKEFKLRKDLIGVRALRQSEAILVPRGAVRRIYAMCTDKGALADFSDAYADDPHFTTVELAARHSSPTIVKQTQYIETYIAMVLFYDAAKGHFAQRFAEIGEKYTILMRLAPAEAPHLKGRVELAIDFFKDHFQRLNRDGDRRQLAAQSAALFEGGPKRQVRAAANLAFFELDSDNAVRRATVGRVRPPRGPFVPGQLVFYLREVKHKKSKRLQGEHGRRGPAIALAAEGHARLHLSYRGAPVLATPEQVRHASRGEAEMVGNEDLARQPSQWRGGPTLQKGFVDERGPGPDGSGGQRDRRRKKDDGDSDNEGAAGGLRILSSERSISRRKTPLNLERYPKYHHYLEMDVTCRTLDLKIHPEMETTCKMLRLMTHLCLMQLGRGAPRTCTRLLCQAIRSNSLSKKALKQSRPPKIEDDEIDDKVLYLKVKNRSTDAFVARGTDTANKQEIAGVEKADILPMRRVRADKNEPARGSLSCEQLSLRAKSRNIAPGYKDKQLLAGELQTNAPTLTDAATAVIIQEAASQPGWSLEQGDVDSAFLNGRYLDSSRRVYFNVPKGGTPAVLELGWPFVPEGTVLKAKKGIYGPNDAPLLWHEQHRGAILSLPGASRSKLRPALFIFHDERAELIGLIGARVDDDIVAGSPEFFANQVAKLRKVHCCGKWQTAKAGFHRCGRFPEQNDDGAIICSKKEYTESIENIPTSAERRKTKEAKATAEARAMLHSGNGQIKWLVRSTRMVLAFRLVESQARARDSDLKAQDLLDYNKLVSDAQTDHVDITFWKLDMDNVVAAAVGDSSHGNVGKTTTASQAGLVILLADSTDDQFLHGQPAKVTPMLWRSHRITRVVGSTLAAEAMAALKAVESGDMLRQHLVESHHGLGCRTHMDDVKEIKMVEVMDCNSLYDLPQKRGAVPSEKRLLIDIESPRNDIKFNNVVSKWVNTEQMLADCLTEQDVRAGDYASCVLRTGECRLTEGPMAGQVISEQRVELKGRRGVCYRSKYPRRHRPADQPFAREGYAYFEDCIVDDMYYEKLEDMVDWSGLGQVAKRRRIPTHARKLLTIYAPTKEALERHENDCTEKHDLKEADTTNDIEHREDANVISDENQITDATADLDDAKEIYMMDTSGAETEGAALVARAVRRVAVGQCERQPRTRKKANHNTPVPNDGDDWVEIPSQTEQSGGSTARKKTTELPIDKARRLHERLRHASHKQVEHDLGDALEEDILE